MLQNSNSKKKEERFPIYLDILNKFDSLYVSSKLIAKETNFTEISVRKDLASISNNGKPKLGFERLKLINDIKNHMRYDIVSNVILVGYGKLGKALFQYKGFTEYGVRVVQAFDTVKQDNVLDISELGSYVKNNNIKFAAMTVPKDKAQSLADLLVESGIIGIWNFTSIRLNVPENIIVQNENLATSLSILIKATVDSEIK